MWLRLTAFSWRQTKKAQRQHSDLCLNLQARDSTNFLSEFKFSLKLLTQQVYPNIVNMHALPKVATWWWLSLQTVIPHLLKIIKSWWEEEGKHAKNCNNMPNCVGKCMWNFWSMPTNCHLHQPNCQSNYYNWQISEVSRYCECKWLNKF